MTNHKIDAARRSQGKSIPATSLAALFRSSPLYVKGTGLFPGRRETSVHPIGLQAHAKAQVVVRVRGVVVVAIG